MASFASTLVPGMGPRSRSIKLIGIILLTAIIFGLLNGLQVNAMTSVDLDTEIVGKCVALQIYDLYKSNLQIPFCYPAKVLLPTEPSVLESNCLIIEYSIVTDVKFLIVTALLCWQVPLPLFLYLKKKLSEANCISHRIYWGLPLFFLICCVTVYLTELNDYRNTIKNCATGSQRSCDCNGEILESDSEILSHIFWKVNPLKSVSKTADILMDGMRRGRERSRVTKLLQELEMGNEDAN